MNSRKLAAIMFTDMVGFSALAQRDEALALALLREHQQLLRSIFAHHGGREVKATGDGFLVEFPSALQAVHCAVAIQTAMSERNSAVTPDRRIDLRIGLHLGDVEVRDSDVFGDGVNIAARIEPLAEAGGICISGPVFDQVRNKIEEPLVRLDEPALKNIEIPIDVYRVVLPWTKAGSKQAGPARAASRLGARVGARVGAMAAVVGVVALLAWWALPRSQDSASTSPVPSASDSSTAIAPAGEGTGNATPSETEALAIPAFGGRPAIAVLPFDNLSPDPEHLFFADGLAEDLITRLSTWRAFPVIARNSSFQYRGGNLDLKRVGRELGVRYVVEGSVRRSGDRIRVTAQLIDATSGEHVWAETYDREITDVFTLQDEISAIIAASLVGDLTRAEGARAQQHGTENLEAWSLYQLGLQSGDRLTREDNAEARRLFERAVVLDPSFATALATLVIANLWEVGMGWSESSQQTLTIAVEDARRAVALDPRDPIAHAALSWTYIMAGNTRNALDSARRAVDLNPSMPDAWNWLSWAQLMAGDPEAAIVSSKQVQRLDPQGPVASLTNDNLANAYWELGHYEEGLEASRRLRAARPEYFPGYVYAAVSYASLGRLDEARAALAEARRLQPDLSVEMLQRLYSVSRPEIDARRNDALRKAGLE